MSTSKRYESRHNLIRMAVLERKIAEYRAGMQDSSVSHWLHGFYKTKLDEAIVEYQERQLMEEQYRRGKRDG